LVAKVSYDSIGNISRGLIAMATVNVRNLPDETHRALRIRAATNGRSTEAEVRAIIEEAVLPQERFKLGSFLAELGATYGGDDLAFERDPTSIKPADFD
jgi:plasmid stability protein